jgi:hypothetical protein
VLANSNRPMSMSSMDRRFIIGLPLIVFQR